MPLPRFVTKVIHDPPPRFAFELSEAGIAVARAGSPPQLGFQPLEPDVIQVSPMKDNVLNMDALSATVQALAARGEKKRQRAVLLLPDFAVRVSVIDFDSFPTDPQQQLPLVRFRVKKSLPFELDSASLGYYAQQNGKKWDVVVAALPLEILARYEAPFRAAGFHPGLVTTSTLCALEMVRGPGVSVLARLSARTLTLAVTDRGNLKLLRSLEFTEGSATEVAAHLFPTFAYIEDQLGAKTARVLLCGFGGALGEAVREEVEKEASLEVEPLRSRFGAPDQFNAGLLGYLETAEEFQ